MVKLEAQSPLTVQPKQKRVRTITRLVERSKSVYERFPAFEKDRVLDFSELFKGYIPKKSRITKRSLVGEFELSPEQSEHQDLQPRASIPAGEIFHEDSWMQLSVTPGARTRTDGLRRRCLLGA